ncbi:phosphomannomutase [Undibacter mobilis]|uniref:Phosphomannomutase n=2 Tax=Undibacter mobilis TaxID=2292256 RepID=A0A371BER4_9BRAD|nr:phosphomannomutase [Undibacter mobilis]
MPRRAFGAAALFVLSALAGTAANAQANGDLVARGGYLVNTVMTCHNCHTPMGPNGPDFSRALSGGLLFDEPPFKVTGSNITQDKETGIGSWTDAQIKHLLRTGQRPNGVQIAAVMPTAFYGIITERDMDAIVAYLRTVKPVKNKVPDPVYKMQIPHHAFPGAEKPYTEAMLSDKVKNGFYLATIAHCMECHTPFGARGKDFVGDLGKGGMEFPGPWGKSVSANITASKAKGLGDWTDAQIRAAITQGVSMDGHKLRPPMGYPFYARMTGEDIDAMIAYLRMVPAKE